MGTDMGTNMKYEISARELAVLLMGTSVASGEVGETAARTAVVLLDVREPWEVAVAAIAGHVPMAMGEVPARAHQELDPDAHIVAYCHAGVRSLSVAHWLREQGFERAQSLAGGIDAWSREVDPTVTRY